MHAPRWTVPAEIACLAVFLVWLAWLPMPFGSVVERARMPLIATPLALCTIAALVRFRVARDRASVLEPTRAWMIWAFGAAAFLAVGALQLVPLPPALLRMISPESWSIRESASRVAALAGIATGGLHPVSVDPHATRFELFRLAALLATFMIAALLVRTHPRRRALAVVLCLTAGFEALYGLREAALQRFEIWGWSNRLIFNRATGTFVNPNHFGHYVAIVLPMALFLLAVQWRKAGTSETPFARRLAMLFERGALMTSFAVFAALTCAAALLLSQSRGAMLAAAAGIAGTIALLPGRRRLRLAVAAVAGLSIVAALALFLGPERTLVRFVPTDVELNALGGRRIAILAGVGLWERFPILGSGLGTFERVVTLEQTEGLELAYHHAHNDYVEIAATAGTLGFVVAVGTLVAGFASLVRLTFGGGAEELSWRRRAFHVAALASITIAAVHALFDFNFHIPSNPATLAAIAGAAVASIDHDRRSRR